MNAETLQTRAARLVQNEVHLCLSSIVSTLAGYTPRMGAYDDARHDRDNRDMMDLTAQAQELCYPLEDWEEAAREAGWIVSDSGQQFINEKTVDDDGLCDHFVAGFSKGNPSADDWRELCEVRDIEPYQREVFEHWAVSPWLADKLLERGEKVDKDFAGLNVWARTTTGQAISSDHVIEEITRELHAPEPSDPFEAYGVNDTIAKRGA